MLTREELGKVVRESWVASKIAERKDGMAVSERHLILWHALPEREKEIDRVIGEAVAQAFLDKVVDIFNAKRIPLIERKIRNGFLPPQDDSVFQVLQEMTSAIIDIVHPLSASNVDFEAIEKRLAK